MYTLVNSAHACLFVRLILVNYDNIFTTKISRFIVCVLTWAAIVTASHIKEFQLTGCIGTQHI